MKYWIVTGTRRERQRLTALCAEGSAATEVSLLPHEEEGAQWLAKRRRGLLGDEPGTGKTYTLARAAQLIGAKRLLVVCPAIGRTHWGNVLRELGHPTFACYSYNGIVNGGIARREEILSGYNPDLLILDEWHRLKSIGAQRTKLLLGRAGYARRIRTAWGASGTPMPKHPGDLWTILSTFHPEVCLRHRLPDRQSFLDRFCVLVYDFHRGAMRERIMPEVKNEEELKEILAETMLRRTLKDIGVAVPSIWWQHVILDAMSSDAAGLTAIRRLTAGSQELSRLPAALEDGASLEEILGRVPPDDTSRLRQAVGIVKAPLVGEWLAAELADSDESLVVFAYHRSVLHVLRTQLAAFGVAYVDGDTSPKQRDIALADFQAKRSRVFLGQNLACQESITLTAAHRAILVEPEFTRSVNLQLAKRIARLTSTADRCIVQLVGLAGTLDEAIVRRNVREQEMAEALCL
jgi:SNF2 family DNA or RNA helicase